MTEARTEQQIREDSARLKYIASLIPDDVLRREVLKFARSGWEAGDPSPKAINAECTTARTEITRMWVSLLNLAWRYRRSKVSALLLEEEELTPETADIPSSVFARWHARLASSRASLRNGVALSDGSLNAVIGLLCKAVKERVEHSPLELPDGLEIAKEGEKVILRERE
jgi:hypothetical protein